MTYDFDLPVVRRGTGCVKWDTPECGANTLPMWVADMDFRVADPIITTLHKRVEHGIFGYTEVGSSYYKALTDWFERRHHWHILPEWVVYTSGVVPAISAIIKSLTLTGDKVLIQTPVYNCFFSSILNNGCQVVENPLLYRNGTYIVDYENMERLVADPRVRLFVLCNPHNPAGRVWTPQELERMNDICLRHNVKVLSDEIHCELVMPGHRFTPFATVSERCRANAIICNSPSKSFNIAGLQIANIICSDPILRERINRAININEVCDVNPFGVEALVAAYNNCEDWLDQLCEYLWGNYQALCQYFAKWMPQLTVTQLEGTYLVWVNIQATGMDADTFTKQLLAEADVLVNSGMMYGAEAGCHFIRINIACRRERMLDGLNRIRQFTNSNFKNQ